MAAIQRCAAPEAGAVKVPGGRATSSCRAALALRDGATLWPTPARSAGARQRRGGGGGEEGRRTTIRMGAARRRGCCGSSRRGWSSQKWGSTASRDGVDVKFKFEPATWSVRLRLDHYQIK